MTVALLGLERMGWGEILLILAVVMLLFGAKRIPEIARSIGKSLGEFKKGQEEGGRPDDPQKPDEGGDDKNAAGGETP